MILDERGLLLGARAVQRAVGVLPRLSRAELLAELGGDRLTASPPAYEELADAAAAAFGLPDLLTASTSTRAAQRAAIVVARRALGTTRAAALVGVAGRSARRHATRVVPPEHTRAVAFQLRMRGMLRATPREMELVVDRGDAGVSRDPGVSSLSAGRG